MTTSHEYKSTGRGREDSLRSEQIFCLKALESGEYDTMSDQEWVAECERVAAGIRHGGDSHESEFQESK